MTDSSAEYEITLQRPKLLGIIIIALIIAGAGSWLVFRYADTDRARDLQTWADKLGLIADTRAEVVSRWVDNYFAEMEKLAQNPTLQLYYSEMVAERAQPVAVPPVIPLEDAAEEATPEAEEPAQKVFLENMLSYTADRMGISEAGAPLTVDAETKTAGGNSGIAIVNKENVTVVSTPLFDSLNEPALNSLSRLPSNMKGLIDVYKTPAGKLQFGFIQPLFPLQADPAANEPMGRIVTIKTLTNEDLQQLLGSYAATEESLEVMLVRSESGNIVYLTPTADNQGPLTKQVENDPKALAEAAAVASPGTFVEGLDYLSQPVIATARPIHNTPWMLVTKINSDVAFHEGTMRRNGMVGLLISIVALMTVTVIAVWYIASSRRLANTSRHFKELAEKAAAQERLLKVVTDTQPEAVSIIDEQGRYCFANAATEKYTNHSSETLFGKSVNDVLGVDHAAPLMKLTYKTLQSKQSNTAEYIRKEEQREVNVRATCVPLQEIPIASLKQPKSGVLLVEQDITEVVEEREKRTRQHQELVEMLVTMMDRRDPHAANHSHMVSHLASALGETLGLDEKTVETLRLSGLLMNVGKIVVPEELLTKSLPLDQEEKQTIRASLLASTDVLRTISFDGEVVETVRQSKERVDGRGPLGLKEEQILFTARIIHTVNAFVSMISPRAYREPLSSEEASNALLEGSNQQFDRKVVIALINLMENEKGRSIVAECMAGRESKLRIASNAG